MSSKPTTAEYLAEVILDHMPDTDDAGGRAHAAARAVIDYLQSAEGIGVLRAISPFAREVC